MQLNAEKKNGVDLLNREKCINMPDVYVMESYEKMRSQVLGTSCDNNRRGMSIMIRSGLAAWIKSQTAASESRQFFNKTPSSYHAAMVDFDEGIISQLTGMALLAVGVT